VDRGLGAKTAYITPGSPLENGNVESFSARLRDELVDGGMFYSFHEAQIIIESWRQHYNTVPCDRTPRSVKSRQLPGCSWTASPHGRLRVMEELRRPRSLWRHDRG
jgi:hypothetical protein